MQPLYLTELSDVNLHRLVHTIASYMLNKEPTLEEGEKFVLITNGNPEYKTILYGDLTIGNIKLEVNASKLSRWIFIPSNQLA